MELCKFDIGPKSVVQISSYWWWITLPVQIPQNRRGRICKKCRNATFLTFFLWWKNANHVAYAFPPDLFLNDPSTKIQHFWIPKNKKNVFLCHVVEGGISDAFTNNSLSLMPHDFGWVLNLGLLLDMSSVTARAGGSVIFFFAGGVGEGCIFHHRENTCYSRFIKHSLQKKGSMNKTVIF